MSHPLNYNSIKRRESNPMKMMNRQAVLNSVISLLIVSMIVLFFCPILIQTQAPSPTTRTESLTSPFLNASTSSTWFLLLVPLILYFIVTVISFFLKSIVMDVIELIFTVYILSISIVFLCVYRFTVTAIVFTLLFAILLLVASLIKLCLRFAKRKTA